MDTMVYEKKDDPDEKNIKTQLSFFFFFLFYFHQDELIYFDKNY